MSNFISENEIVSLRFIHFKEYTARNGGYKFYKLFFEDKDNKKTFCVKINKNVFYKLLNDTLNSEDIGNVIF